MKVLLPVIAALLVAPVVASVVAPARTYTAPARYVWVGDRSEDLRFLPADTGVALVQTSIELEGSAVRVRPRATSLVTPAGAEVLPVVHVDAFSRWHALLTAHQEDVLVDAVVDAARRSGGRTVQIDFEALPSQREFYRRVLARVRMRLPTTRISITALASWCMNDRWLQTAPVDEVVAMAFRMGRDAPAYRERIAQYARWPAAECGSTGIATDEPALRLPAYRTLYLFSPTPWTAQQWRALQPQPYQPHEPFGSRT
jgi:hypothetical protein